MRLQLFANKKKHWDNIKIKPRILKCDNCEDLLLGDGTDRDCHKLANCHKCCSKIVF